MSTTLQAGPVREEFINQTPQEQKAYFEQNGFLIVPNVLSQQQLASIREMTDKLLNGDIKPEIPNPQNGELPEDFVLQMEPAVAKDESVPRREKIRVAFHLCHTHPYFRSHATRPEIASVVETLLGPGALLYTDQLFVKPPHHGSEVPFHQDHAYWTMMEPYGAISCWLALDDVTVENGCVRMIPGTHHALVPHRTFEEGPQAYGLHEEDVEADREVPIQIKAGDAMFHHSLTIHRSFPNHSDYGRRGLVTIYMPGNSHLVQPWPFPYGFRPVNELREES